MRVCVTENRDTSPPELRPAGELAPSLALPWIAKLRDGVLIGLILLLLAAHFVFHIEMPIVWLAIPLGLSAASNILLHVLMKPFTARPALGFLLAFDTVCLTATLALSGGPANPFSVLYLVEITLSAVVLSKAWTWTLGGLSVLGFGSLFWAHVHVPAFEGHHDMVGFSAHLVGMWIAFTMGAFLITVFIGKVSQALRHQEEEARQFQEKLAHHRRLASIATLAAGAAHELGTPLASIAVASRDLEIRGDLPGSEKLVAEDARLIRAEVERCSRILRQMGGRNAEPAGEMPAEVSLQKICAEVKGELPVEKSAFLNASAPANASVFLPPGGLRQALAALVKNALESSPSGKPVTLSVESDAERVRFSIQDSGSGMSAETLHRITEPFFTTKSPGRGLGLGTFLVRVFAESLHGNLIFDSEPGSGTKAILELPIHCHDGKR
jgi:two-component system, sensor histidine kinase RegB